MAAEKFLCTNIQTNSTKRIICLDRKDLVKQIAEVHEVNMKQWILQEYDEELAGYVDVIVVDAIASELLQIVPRLGALVEAFLQDPMDPMS